MHSQSSVRNLLAREWMLECNEQQKTAFKEICAYGTES